MDATLHLAIWGAIAGLSISTVLSYFTTPKTDQELAGLVYDRSTAAQPDSGAWYSNPKFVSVVIVVILIALNVSFR